MLNNILAIVKGDGSNWAGQNKSPNNYYFDNFGEPFLYALIGFLVVFVGIFIIILTIWLVGLIMRKTNNLEFLHKNKGKGGQAKKNVQPTEVIEKVADDEISPEVKAAIVAAIMAYYEEQPGHCEFTVKRIKRI